MAANPSVGQNPATLSSPEDVETPEGANDEGFFDVWLIKGIRVFWNSKTKKRQKRYLVSWLGYPCWDDSWEPRENIGQGCDDLVAHVERAAALGPEPAVGTEWLASEDWLKMEAKSRLRSTSDPGFQARINQARKLEEEDKRQGNTMAIRKGSGIRAAALQNLAEYENYKAERNPPKRQPPASVKKKTPVDIQPINKESRRWFPRTRRSTRHQGYFHYSGDDQELAEMTIHDDFAATPKAIRRVVSSGKAPVPRRSTGSNKKRRRSSEPSSGENEGSRSELFIEASEASDDDIPLVRLRKRKVWEPVSRPKKKKRLYVEGPPKKKRRIDPQPKLPTPPPDSESSGAGVPLIKQKKVQVLESSSDEDEPLAIQARKNKPQAVATGTPAQPLNILTQPAPVPNLNPKATINPNPAPSRSMTLPSNSSSRAQAKRSATGPSLTTTDIPSSTVGGGHATLNNPPLSSYLLPHSGGPIVQGGVPWLPVNQAVNRKQYVGTSSKQQGLSLSSRARMLGEAPAVGPNRQVDRPSNTTTVTRLPEPGPIPPRSGVTAAASRPSKPTENNEDEDLFGDNELEETEQPDNLDVEMDLNIDMSEPMMVESPPVPPKQAGPAPTVASKAAQLEVEATGFLTDVMADVAPAQAGPRFEPQKGPRRIELYLGSPGAKRLCEVYLANVSIPSLPSAHLNKWIFIPGGNHSIYLDRLHSASHAPLILPAFEPMQWARIDPWDNEADTRPLGALNDWLTEANQFAILEVPNKPAFNFCILSPRCKPFFDVFPNANHNYREEQGLVLVLLKRRFNPSQGALPRKPSPTPESLLKLPREVLYQDPNISRGLMLLKLPQSTFRAWQTAWQPVGKVRSFGLFTIETILYRKLKLYGDQLPAHEHAAWGLKHQPETKALLKILEMTRLKPWHLMERTDITFLHNNSWEFLKKLPGLHDRLGCPHIQFFAFGPHHSLSPDKWGVREVFKRGAVVTFTARLIAENGETFKKLVEKIHKSPISVAYVTPLTVALVELMVTDVRLYPNNLESLRFLLDAILDSQISLMTAPPYSWKHDDMNKWREMQFTFGAEQSRFQVPIEGLAFSLDKETTAPPLQYRTYDSILTACAKELETFQQELPVAYSNEVDVGFRRLGRPLPHSASTTTKERISKTALQLEADINTTLYSDLRLMQSNHFYQTEYRHFVVIESRDSTAGARDKVVDSIAHLTTDEVLPLVDPVTQNRTNIV